MTTNAVTVLANIPDCLRTPLVDEYNKIAKNFREGRWEPAELSGGKLCEIVYSILKGHVDGSFPNAPYKPKSMADDCRKLEQAGSTFPRSIRIQIPRMLIALYEVRNNRNVGHVGADVDPSHMDASVVFAMCQWIMAELVRVFHSVSTDEATAVVESLIERPVPLLWKVGERTRVLGPGMSAKDKMMALLYGSASPMTVREVVDSIEYSNPTRFRTGIVIPAHKAGLIDFNSKTGALVISPLGQQYVEKNVPLTI
jgi:hypothetical protein